MRRIAFFGGSFDPVHRGHLNIAEALTDQFQLDEFVFIPAFHAPHKVRLKPTSAYDRYTMLCLATAGDERSKISRIEIEAPERPFAVETLTELKTQLPDAEIFFVMGADSWMDIPTWREWTKVLTMVNHIIMTRPGAEIGFDHVSKDIQERIVDLRADTQRIKLSAPDDYSSRIFLVDSVCMRISATDIRQRVRAEDESWHEDVTPEVANYIEKYQIYK